MSQEEPADISERSSGIREEHRKLRKEFFTCNIKLLKIAQTVKKDLTMDETNLSEYLCTPSGKVSALADTSFRPLCTNFKQFGKKDTEIKKSQCFVFLQEKKERK